MRYALENGCPYDASEEAGPKCLYYLRKNGYRQPDLTKEENKYEDASEEAGPRCLHYLSKNGYNLGGKAKKTLNRQKGGDLRKQPRRIRESNEVD